MFCAWAKRFHREPLPAATETVALYLTELLTRGKKITTVRRRKCAIFYEHVARGLPAPNAREIQELLRGAQRLRGEKPRQMRAISVRELRRMYAHHLARIGTSRALRGSCPAGGGFRVLALRRSTSAPLNPY